MHTSHGMGYGDYNNKLENRMQVEEKREKDYQESQKIVKQFINE